MTFSLIWSGAGQATFAEWQSASLVDLASLHGQDPEFSNAGSAKFHTSPSSPAVATGAILAESLHGAVNFAGHPRITGGKIDRGAYQH
ncbi:hypothetical protein [Parapedobacter tibetensis]|uniref:hypothetical protein n=1 Tax=Parapedobacter tibetensis TaxID=2972951 RepID=UPI00214D8415|nr:hypothetical protein [Parapedobacter tibetensis]